MPFATTGGKATKRKSAGKPCTGNANAATRASTNGGMAESSVGTMIRTGIATTAMTTIAITARVSLDLTICRNLTKRTQPGVLVRCALKPSNFEQIGQLKDPFRTD